LGVACLLTFSLRKIEINLKAAFYTYFM